MVTAVNITTIVVTDIVVTAIIVAIVVGRHGIRSRGQKRGQEPQSRQSRAVHAGLRSRTSATSMVCPREIPKKEKQKKEKEKKSSSRRRRIRKRTFAGAAVAEDAVARGRRVLGEVWNPSAQEAAVAEDAAAEGRAAVAVAALVGKNYMDRLEVSAFLESRKVVFNDQPLAMTQAP